MLRLVDRLLYKELIPPLVFGIAAFTSLFFAGSYLATLTNLLVQGVSGGVVLKMFLLYLPGVIVLTLPMSVLLSVLLGFARLSSDSEMIALWAGGVSLWRLMRPVAVVALAVTLMTFAINEWLAPQANKASNDLKAAALGEASAVQRPFIITDTANGSYASIVIVQGGLNPKTKELRNVAILSGFTESGPRQYITAERGIHEGGPNWVLYNGRINTIGSAASGTSEFREFSMRAVKIDRTAEEMEEEQRRGKELTFGQLARRIRRLKAEGQDTVALEVDLYNKLALPFAGVVFAMIGAPLGLRPHRGGSAVGFGLSLGLIFAYWMVWQYMSALAKSGHMSPLTGSFTANIAFAIVGIVLLVRASR